MKPLNVRFTDEAKKEIDDYAAAIGVATSKLARTALNLGLGELKSFDKKHPGYAKKVINAK